MKSMHRRSVLSLLGTSAAAWPLVARAQQQKGLGVLMNRAATGSRQAQLTSFMQGMRKLGWIEGQNLQTKVRWGAADPSLIHAYATELVDLFKPDVLLAAGTSALTALQRATNTIPIVFTQVSDPVDQGLVSNLARPGGNITGFSSMESSTAGKWADLIKQMAPSITRVALVFNPETDPQSKLFVSAMEAAAPSLGVGVMAAPVHSTPELEATLARVAREPNIGLIVSGGTFVSLHAKLIVEAEARYRLPAIYGGIDFVAEGGLMHYFSDPSEEFRLAPFYIDRILKGAKAGDLPVQLPTKFKFIVNRKTASALGIEVPLGLLLAADEVIE
jgi:putative tryptophan/tyrosine transport system substrate-binding protein